MKTLYGFEITVNDININIYFTKAIEVPDDFRWAARVEGLELSTSLITGNENTKLGNTEFGNGMGKPFIAE